MWFFTIFLQYMNTNIVKIILVVPLERNWTSDISYLQM